MCSVLGGVGDRAGTLRIPSPSIPYFLLGAPGGRADFINMGPVLVLTLCPHRLEILKIFYSGRSFAFTTSVANPAWCLDDQGEVSARKESHMSPVLWSG